MRLWTSVPGSSGRWMRALACGVGAVLLGAAGLPGEDDGSVISLSVVPTSGRAHVVIGVDGAVTVRDFMLQNPDRIVVDITDGALKTIYNNFSSYPLGRYWCCSGWTISGPTSPIAQDIAVAMPFTAPGNGAVTRIAVAAGYVTGTNGVTVSLYDDSGGLPGTSLGSLDSTGLPQFGSCCTVVVSNVGIPITAGSKYWVVLSTGPNTLDTWDAWNQNDTNQTNQPFASRTNGVWTLSSGILGAFAVQGMPN